MSDMGPSLRSVAKKLVVEVPNDKEDGEKSKKVPVQHGLCYFHVSKAINDSHHTRKLDGTVRRRLMCILRLCQAFPYFKWMSRAFELCLRHIEEHIHCDGIEEWLDYIRATYGEEATSFKWTESHNCGSPSTDNVAENYIRQYKLGPFRRSCGVQENMRGLLSQIESASTRLSPHRVRDLLDEDRHCDLNASHYFAVKCHEAYLGRLDYKYKTVFFFSYFPIPMPKRYRSKKNDRASEEYIKPCHLEFNADTLLTEDMEYMDGEENYVYPSINFDMARNLYARLSEGKFSYTDMKISRKVTMVTVTRIMADPYNYDGMQSFCCCSRFQKSASCAHSAGIRFYLGVEEMSPKYLTIPLGLRAVSSAGRPMSSATVMKKLKESGTNIERDIIQKSKTKRSRKPKKVSTPSVPSSSKPITHFLTKAQPNQMSLDQDQSLAGELTVRQIPNPGEKYITDGVTIVKSNCPLIPERELPPAYNVSKDPDFVGYIGDTPVFRRTFNSIFGLMFDEVLHFYGRYLTKTIDPENKTIVFGPYFMQHLSQCTAEHMPNIPLDPFDSSVIYIMNGDNIHWNAYTVHFEMGSFGIQSILVALWDSMYHKPDPVIIGRIKQWLTICWRPSGRGTTLPTIHDTTVFCQKQNDGISCGAYVLGNLRGVLQESNLYNKVKIGLFFNYFPSNKQHIHDVLMGMTHDTTLKEREMALQAGQSASMGA